MFLKPVSAVWKLFRNWLLFYTQTPLVHQLITLSSKIQILMLTLSVHPMQQLFSICIVTLNYTCNINFDCVANYQKPLTGFCIYSESL